MSLPGRAGVVAICVPVRNEIALLPRLLDALAEQVGSGICVISCFAFDACSDGSEDLVAARATALPYEVRTLRLAATGEPNAGRARRAALELGQRSVAVNGNAALLTTDADSVPAHDWIAANLYALGVADVVAGRIERDRAFVDEGQDRLETYYDALFALRRSIDAVPWEAERTHHYTGGASLAFRASAYAAIGGFQPISSAEDARIVDDAHRAGVRVRRDAAVQVVTSSRREGRAAGGLADHLHHVAHSRSGQTGIRVAHPEQMAWQYAGHAAARRAFEALDGAKVAQLAEYLQREPEIIRETAEASPNAEAFAMRVVPGHPAGERLVSLDEAEAALDALRGRTRVLAA